MTTRCDIGVVGLGVMGRNLALNLRDRGFRVAVHDAAEAALARCVAGTTLGGCDRTAALAVALRTPRTILLMVPAGPPVDDALALLAPSLQPGDILLDRGNSHFLDTRRRHA